MKLLLFFGCWGKDRLGHFLYDSHGNSINEYRRRESKCPLSANQLDGIFAPRWTEPMESEAVTALTHVHGWTVLAMWDRSADTRYASNAAFLMPGTHTAEEVWDVARLQYPQIVQRLKAAHVVEVPNGRS